MVRSETDFADSAALPSKTPLISIPPGLLSTKRFFQLNCLEFDFISVSGQNPTIPVHFKFKIRDRSAKFLTNADILKMI